jgi:hypothetical protein
VPEAVDYLACALLTGAGATSVMDIWAAARKGLLGIPPPDYGLVGRWLAYLARGRGMCNRMAHGYFDIDLSIVWHTVQSSLPELERQLGVLVSETAS